MQKFSIAFIAPTDKVELRHKIVVGENQDSALRLFFNEEVTDLYSDDEKGFFYFKEDFFDKASKSGNIIKIN